MQPDLFDPPPRRSRPRLHVGPYGGRSPIARQSSRDAAIASRATAPTQRERVRRAIAMAGHMGCTDRELAGILNLPINVITPRRGELAEAGSIVALAERRIVQHSNGKVLKHTVWVCR